MTDVKKPRTRKMSKSKRDSQAMQTAKIYARRKTVEAKFLKAREEFIEKYYDEENDEWLKIPNMFGLCQSCGIKYSSFVSGKGAYDRIHPAMKNWIADILMQQGDKMAMAGKRTSWYEFRLQKYMPRVEEEDKKTIDVNVKILPILQAQIQQLAKNDITDINSSMTQETAGERLLGSDIETVEELEARKKEEQEQEETAEIEEENFLQGFVKSDKAEEDKRRRLSEALKAKAEAEETQDSVTEHEIYMYDVPEEETEDTEC